MEAASKMGLKHDWLDPGTRPVDYETLYSLHVE